jgi:flagellar basal-body rod protein FlgB
VLDLTMQAIRASLDGLAARQRIIAMNLANSETPGYIAQTVSFEESLFDAIDRARPAATDISTDISADPVNVNGNNVSVDKEALALTDTSLRYQLAAESINNKFRVLRDSMRHDL